MNVSIVVANYGSKLWNLQYVNLISLIEVVVYHM